MGLPNGWKRWGVAAAGVALTAMGTIIGSVWAASAARARLAEHVQVNGKKIDDHEVRLRLIETRLTEMGTDVKWIRHTLENKR